MLSIPLSLGVLCVSPGLDFGYFTGSSHSLEFRDQPSKRKLCPPLLYTITTLHRVKRSGIKMAAMNKVEPGVPPPHYTPYPPQPGQGPAYGGLQAYPPQPYVPMAAQQQSMNNTVVVTGQPTYAPLIVRYGEGPIMVTCPHCHATVTTSTHYTVGTFAWLICLIILLLGFWLGCCLIPFCVDSCKDVIHSCPNCQQQLGKYNRM